MPNRILRLAAMLAALAPAAAGAQQPRNGAELLERMRAAYANTWYHTLTFTQKTTQFRDTARIVSTWYESLAHTGEGVKLRIDVGDPADGNGILYTADSSWRLRKGVLAMARADGNEFLPLIEGVYVQPVARTMAELAHTNVDMNKIGSGTWEGRPNWIIGTTSAADSTVPQIWVDKERNVVTHVVLRQSETSVMTIALDDYKPAGKGWLATKVVMAVNGKPVQQEEYSGWKTDVDLSPALFDVRSWTTAPHWVKK